VVWSTIPGLLNSEVAGWAQRGARWSKLWIVFKRLPAEPDLVGLMEPPELEETHERGAVTLRAVREPWPFLPHARVVPEVVAAIDLVVNTFD
jgi:hypothetical protein